MSQANMIYLNFFGLQKRPFPALPNPAAIYWSNAHQNAYAMMKFAVATFAPIAVITGEVGSGKTTLVRHLLDELPADYTVALLSNAQGSRLELLQWVLMALGQDVPDGIGYVKLFRQFQTFLIDEYAAGRRTVLIVDEAQHLTAETIEELRMFSNINADDDELLQIILVGQPKLREIISAPAQANFAQRLSAEYNLRPMSKEDVENYVRHRMARCGVTDEIFTEDACLAIFAASRGLPRIINQICEYALVYAFSLDRRLVTAEIIERVICDRLEHSAVLADDTWIEGPDRVRTEIHRLNRQDEVVEAEIDGTGGPRSDHPPAASPDEG